MFSSSSATPPPSVDERQQQQHQQLNLEHLFLNAKGVFLCNILPFLTARDVGRLEGVSRTIRRVLVAEQQPEDSNRNDDSSTVAAPAGSSSNNNTINNNNNYHSGNTAPWKILWVRDFDRSGALAASAAAQSPMTMIPVAAAGRPTGSTTTNQHLESYTTKSGPVDGDNNNNNNVDQSTFHHFLTMGSWKQVYAAWSVWKNRTRGLILPYDMVRAVLVWNRFKAWVTAAQRTKPALHLEHIVDSLQEGLSVQDFTRLHAVPLLAPPSSVLAFQSVHVGQTYRYDWDNPFIGLFGAWSVCYEFSMRDGISMNMTQGNGFRSGHGTVLGANGGRNAHVCLCVGPDDSQLCVMPTIHMPLNYLMNRPVVAHFGQGGILSYFERYIERLETGIYQADCIVPTDDATGSICLFPAADLGDGSWSCCISHGIEVRASARWMYRYRYGVIHRRQLAGLNFAYSVRIRMVDNSKNNNWQQLGAVGRDLPVGGPALAIQRWPGPGSRGVGEGREWQTTALFSAR
jgi:hypothetical protein